jgi:NAD(P)-dependent dehydrogenase (short-subunit alcohol dehydrogenase family)
VPLASDVSADSAGPSIAKVTIPPACAAEPIEQAHGFLYLASDDAQYVTGHVLVIDGGSILGKPRSLFD